MKTITISDEVYEKLVRLKRNRSFSAVIEDLIRRDVGKRIELLISSLEKTEFEDELEEIAKKIRKEFKVRE